MNYDSHKLSPRVAQWTRPHSSAQPKFQQLSSRLARRIGTAPAAAAAADER